jgi:hypothetical protein
VPSTSACTGRCANLVDLGACSLVTVFIRSFISLSYLFHSITGMNVFLVDPWGLLL